MWMRIWAGLSGLFFGWWAYRLLTNPFVACEWPGTRLPGRWVGDLCSAGRPDVAAAIVLVVGIVCIVLASWPKRRASAA